MLNLFAVAMRSCRRESFLLFLCPTEMHYPPSSFLCKPRTTDLRPWLWGASLRGSSKHSSPDSRPGRSVVRGKAVFSFSSKSQLSLVQGFGAPLAPRPPAATLPELARMNLPEFPAVSSGFHPAQALGGCPLLRPCSAQGAHSALLTERGPSRP